MDRLKVFKYQTDTVDVARMSVLVASHDEQTLDLKTFFAATTAAGPS
jgi:hypothetical protein